MLLKTGVMEGCRIDCRWNCRHRHRYRVGGGRGAHGVDWISKQ